MSMSRFLVLVAAALLCTSSSNANCDNEYCADLNNRSVRIPANLNMAFTSIHNWRVDFTIVSVEGKALVCVSVDYNTPFMNIFLYPNRCTADNTPLSVYPFSLRHTDAGELLIIQLTHNSNNVGVKLNNHEPIFLSSRNVTLPDDNTWIRNTHRDAVSFLVGCPIKCPSVQVVNGGEEVTKVKELQKANDNKFLLKYNDDQNFTKLEIDIVCKSSLGSDHVTDSFSVTHFYLQEKWYNSENWLTFSLLMNNNNKIIQLAINQELAGTILLNDDCYQVDSFRIYILGNAAFIFACNNPNCAMVTTSVVPDQPTTVTSCGGISKTVLVVSVINFLIILPLMYLLLHCAGFSFVVFNHSEDRFKFIKRLWKGRKSDPEAQEESYQGESYQVTKAIVETENADSWDTTRLNHTTKDDTTRRDNRTRPITNNDNHTDEGQLIYGGVPVGLSPIVEVEEEAAKVIATFPN
ncbi:hypothetical protein HgNV_021 [Homarus gammarus nudivirus]|uniref:Uncharacterized protein n=1 Tax=Homarus gammarus nudivirus TaxID=2509616 RepID=A0A411HB58_9VIRU|nr:hypothetical protein KM727_gp21 [Homarus gammarus nudivirus]QBB28626.1 hypothetical protein HgNV_021 [Homarus gammarus nudivirus]